MQVLQQEQVLQGINADLQSGINVTGSGYNGAAGSKSFVINQYNTSPKPLNRLDIYRDTKRFCCH